MTLIEKVQSLLTAANATTGTADTDLTAAVQRLIAGYGGGGGDAPQWITVTAASGVTIYGNVVKTGHKVTWTGRAEFSSSVSGDRLIFTLPTGTIPYFKYLFKCGSGGSGYDDTGYILPNGEVHVVIANTKNFVNCAFSWDVIDPAYTPTYTAKIATAAGGVELIDGMAIMQLDLSLQNISTGWQWGILTIPPAVRPISDQYPFCVYGSRISAQYPDCILGTTGELGVYVDAGLLAGQHLYILGVWKT